jgi:hypothetical protein
MNYLKYSEPGITINDRVEFNAAISSIGDVADELNEIIDASGDSPDWSSYGLHAFFRINLKTWYRKINKRYPKIISFFLDLEDSSISSLIGMPSRDDLAWTLRLSGTDLSSLEGLPQGVVSLKVSNTKLKDLKYLAESDTRFAGKFQYMNVDISNCSQLTSFAGIPETCGILRIGGSTPFLDVNDINPNIASIAVTLSENWKLMEMHDLVHKKRSVNLNNSVSVCVNLDTFKEIIKQSKHSYEVSNYFYSDTALAKLRLLGDSNEVIDDMRYTFQCYLNELIMKYPDPFEFQDVIIGNRDKNIFVEGITIFL